MIAATKRMQYDN